MINESANLKIIGEFNDIVHHKDGRVEDLGWNKNLIVNNASVLIACLMKGQTGYSGLQYWAVGSGSASWDTVALPEIAQLVVNSDATSSASLTVNLGGTGFNVAVLSGDTATTVATKIRNSAYSGWTTGGTGTTVTFTSNATGNVTNATFSAGTTGVSATMTTTQDGLSAIGRPDPLTTDSKLVNEIFRKQIQPANITFLDSNGATSALPTNVIQIDVIFNETEAVGTWREFALFGGNATATKDSGLNINYKTHGIIPKDSDMSIERKIKFTFLKA